MYWFVFLMRFKWCVLKWRSSASRLKQGWRSSRWLIYLISGNLCIEHLVCELADHSLKSELVVVARHLRLVPRRIWCFPEWLPTPVPFFVLSTGHLLISAYLLRARRGFSFLRLAAPKNNSLLWTRRRPRRAKNGGRHSGKNQTGQNGGGAH